jgi:hypothetical protein
VGFLRSSLKVMIHFSLHENLTPNCVQGSSLSYFQFLVGILKLELIVEEWTYQQLFLVLNVCPLLFMKF